VVKHTQLLTVRLAYAFSIRTQRKIENFSKFDLDLIKKICLFSGFNQFPSSILTQLGQSKHQVALGQILLAISTLQKLEKNQLINLLFGSTSHPTSLILKMIRLN